MKIVKKIFFISFLFFIVFINTIGVKRIVKTIDNNTVSNSITMVGASIRKTGVQGLRFTAKINYEELESELGITVNDISKYGICVCYGEATNDQLFLGTICNNKNVLFGESDSLFNIERKEFTVVLYNFSEELYLQGYSARAYVKCNDERIIYSDEVITRSIYQIAKLSVSESPNEYIENIVSYGDNLYSNIYTIQDAKAIYDENNSQLFKICGVVTALSTGKTPCATIEDESGAIVLYGFSSTYSDILKVGNKVLVETTLQTYNGLYESKTINSIVRINSGNQTLNKELDVSYVFELGGMSNQSKIASGFLEFNQTSDDQMNFKTENLTPVILYCNDKWSTYTAQNLNSGEFYYVHGFVTYYSVYDKLELVPIDANNAVLSITSATAINVLDNYELNSFDISNIKIEFTLSDGKKILVNANEQMLSEEDLERLNSSGSKNIILNCYGRSISCSFNITDKEIESIEVNNFKTNYFIGEELDLSGSTILVKYVDNTTNTVELDESMVSGFDSLVNGQKEVTVSYGTKSVKVNYNVNKEIIIYDIYGAGGNSGATYKNDFVVLYNNTNKNITLNGYKFLYAKYDGTSFSKEIDLSGNTIYANSYFVIKTYTGTNGTEIQYTNLSCTAEMGGTSGRVAICQGDKPTSVTDASLLDNVLYDKLSSTKSYRRVNTASDDFSAVTVDLSYLENGLEIVDIDVTNIKTKYHVGDSLSLTNATFKVIYKNGASIILDVTSNDITGFSSIKTGVYKMQFTYQNFTVYIQYIVATDEGSLDVEICFIDLGDNIADCGESTYIKVGNDIDILIDCGENSTISANAVKTVINNNTTDNKLEYVIASHAHSDHIGGMRYVLPNYDIDNVIEFDYKYGDDVTSKSVIGYYLKERAKASNIYTAYNLVKNSDNGTSYKITIAEDIFITLYKTGKLGTTTSDKNCHSVVLVFEAYGKRVLFNGDAEKSCEDVYAPLVGDVDIFKLGHHGTYNATSANLLNYIKPEVAIVCNGNFLGNEYGHPTIDAMQRVYNYSTNTKLYALTGAIITSTDITNTDAPGSSLRVLYAYKTSSRYNFYFKCNSPSDAMTDRNGNITVSINPNGYTISSEFNGLNPIEMRQTQYWNSMNSYIA